MIALSAATLVEGGEPVVWTSQGGGSALTTPVLYEGRIYAVSAAGVATCIDAKTGDLLWRARLAGRYSSSPIAIAGRVYFTGDAGKTTVVAAAPAFEVSGGERHRRVGRRDAGAGRRRPLHSWPAPPVPRHPLTMLLDARAVDSQADLDADICIVGAGAAGITLALELIDRPMRVVVLEGGVHQTDEGSQHLYQGATTGQPYYALDECRVRYLGGSTNAWGGWCRPLDAIDFTARDCVPHSGWPFPRDTLNPYYERAHAMCRLGPCDYDAQRWNAERASIVPAHAREFADTLFHIRPTRFGQEHRACSNERRTCGCCCTRPRSRSRWTRPPDRGSPVGRHADRHPVRRPCRRVRAGGRRYRKPPPAACLATRPVVGHRERARPRRPFLHRTPARARGAGDAAGPASGFYAAHRVGAATIRGAVRVTDDARRRERLLGCALTFHNADDPHDMLSPARMPAAYESLGVLMRAMRRRTPRGLRHLGNILTPASTRRPRSPTRSCAKFAPGA